MANVHVAKKIQIAKTCHTQYGIRQTTRTEGTTSQCAALNVPEHLQRCLKGRRDKKINLKRWRGKDPASTYIAKEAKPWLS